MLNTSVHARLTDPRCSATPPEPIDKPDWMTAMVTAHVNKLISPVCLFMVRS